MKIVRADFEDIPKLALLADEIWHQHFKSIITDEQIEYMLENFQSEKAMEKQMSQQNYEYYFFNVDGESQGYFAIQPLYDEKVMFISKIYLRQAHRGNGYARQAFEFIENEAKSRGLTKTRLTVNRHNDISISVYKALGMHIAEEKKADIGNGFVMDDYVFEAQVNDGK